MELSGKHENFLGLCIDTHGKELEFYKNPFISKDELRASNRYDDCIVDNMKDIPCNKTFYVTVPVIISMGYADGYYAERRFDIGDTFSFAINELNSDIILKYSRWNGGWSWPYIKAILRNCKAEGISPFRAIIQRKRALSD